MRAVKTKPFLIAYQAQTVSHYGPRLADEMFGLDTGCLAAMLGNGTSCAPSAIR